MDVTSVRIWKEHKKQISRNCVKEMLKNKLQRLFKIRSLGEDRQINMNDEAASSSAVDISSGCQPQEYIADKPAAIVVRSCVVQQGGCNTAEERKSESASPLPSSICRSKSGRFTVSAVASSCAPRNLQRQEGDGAMEVDKEPKPSPKWGNEEHRCQRSCPSRMMSEALITDANEQQKIKSILKQPRSMSFIEPPTQPSFDESCPSCDQDPEHRCLAESLGDWRKTSSMRMKRVSFSEVVTRSVYTSIDDTSMDNTRASACRSKGKANNHGKAKNQGKGGSKKKNDHNVVSRSEKLRYYRKMSSESKIRNSDENDVAGAKQNSYEKDQEDSDHEWIQISPRCQNKAKKCISDFAYQSDESGFESLPSSFDEKTEEQVMMGNEFVNSRFEIEGQCALNITWNKGNRMDYRQHFEMTTQETLKSDDSDDTDVVQHVLDNIVKLTKLNNALLDMHM